MPPSIIIARSDRLRRETLPNVVKALTDERRRAETEIKNRVIALKGAPGRPVGEVQFATGDGYRQQYENGDIFYLPPNTPCWVYGSILVEYNALGAEGGFLGYPITDERGTPDGAGRYNHFQHGSIYWSYKSGAHEVHGTIRDKWAALGWERSYLGFPISGERPFTDGGRISCFQNGCIYWWPDVGAFDLGAVTFRYKGLYCFGETDEWSASDEPYVLIGVAAPPGASFAPPAAVRSPIYEDVDSGDERPDDIEVYRGSPLGLAVGVTMMEHDEGNPDVYLGLVQEGVALAGKGVAQGCAALFGPEAAAPCEKVFSTVAPMIVSAINGLIGTGDDRIGTTTFHISAKEMVMMARQPWKRFWGITYHWETELISDGEASYKVYFSLDPA